MTSFNYKNFTINKERKDFHKCPIKEGCYCDLSTNKENPYKWDFLDAIYCICLKDRPDRFENSSARFHQYGLCEYITYYRPDKDVTTHTTNASGRGCWNSHRKVIKKAKESLYTKILIFEDDMYFSKDYNIKTVNNIKNDISILPVDWDVFYLGHFPLYSYHYKNNIYRTFSLSLHAYIVNLQNNFSEYIIKTSYDYQIKPITIDMLIMKKYKTYSNNKMIAFQDNTVSNNSKKGFYLINKITTYCTENYEFSAKKAENIASTLPLIIIFLFFIFILILFRIFRKK